MLGFDEPDFHGDIAEELRRLGESGAVRLIDALAIHKDAEGGVEAVPLGASGSTVGALVGLAERGREPAAKGLHAFAEDDAWDVIEDIPPDTAAALILVEHRWAVPLCDAVVHANGFRIADGFIRPVDLVAVGLLSAEEAGKPAVFAR